MRRTSHPRFAWRDLLTALASCVVFCAAPAARGQLEAVVVYPDERPLCVMNADGTGLRVVARTPARAFHGSPQWSPDGKRIAFDAHGPSFSAQHVLVVELATSKVVDLGGGGFPTWSPDGRWVAFHSSSGIARAHPDGMGPRELVTAGTHPRWSPDGDQMAYLNGNDLTVRNLIDGSTRVVFEEAAGELHWGCAWSPDGRQLALTRTIDDHDELVIVDAGGSSLGLRIRYRGQMSTHVGWSSDRKHLLFGQYGPRDGPRHLHLLAPKGSARPAPLPRQAAEWDYCDGVWSPDGKQVVFSLAVRKR